MGGGQRTHVRTHSSQARTKVSQGIRVEPGRESGVHTVPAGHTYPLWPVALTMLRRWSKASTSSFCLPAAMRCWLWFRT